MQPAVTSVPSVGSSSASRQSIMQFTSLRRPKARAEKRSRLQRSTTLSSFRYDLMRANAVRRLILRGDQTKKITGCDSHGIAKSRILRPASVANRMR